MKAGARTPEELETLFEDAFVIRDRDALAGLFDEGALLIPGRGSREARGGSEIAQVVTALWGRGRTYLADSRQVLQTRGTALVVAEESINVMRRGDDGAWRFSISLLAPETQAPKEAR